MTIKLRDVVLVLAGFALGLVALGRAWANDPGQQIVTTSAARAPTPPAAVGARYQYRCEIKWPEKMYDGEVIRRLNELGAQGWHLMPPMIVRSPGFAYGDVYCFERAY